MYKINGSNYPYIILTSVYLHEDIVGKVDKHIHHEDDQQCRGQVI